MLVIPDISRTETRTSILILYSKKLQRQPNIYIHAFKRKRNVLPRQSIASNYVPPPFGTWNTFTQFSPAIRYYLPPWQIILIVQPDPSRRATLGPFPFWHLSSPSADVHTGLTGAGVDGGGGRLIMMMGWGVAYMIERIRKIAALFRLTWFRFHWRTWRWMNRRFSHWADFREQSGASTMSKQCVGGALSWCDSPASLSLSPGLE